MIPEHVAQQVRAALEALREEDPEGWPEALVSIAAGFCHLDQLNLSLLADAAVMAASSAAQLEEERMEEEEGEANRVQRN